MQREIHTWQVRRTALEVNLGLLRKNFTQLLHRAGKGELLALVKADAYGHSQKEISRALESGEHAARLRGFGVANVEEGIALRRDGIKKPIYVMSGVQVYDEDLHRCLETCSLTPVISSLPVLRSAAEVTKKLGARTKLHLKFNTGMTRLGIDASEVPECLKLLRANPQLEVEGLMSHLAQGEKPESPLSRRQVKEFRAIVKMFAGVPFRFHHLCNSAGLAENLYPEGNLARVGLNLYGLGDESLHPVATWRAQIYQVREISKGETVGYGARFKAKKKMRIAVLGVGYADGYRRIFSNRSQVIVRGKRCRVIGSVSMDLTAIDISAVPSASTKDFAVLLGGEGKERILAEELAAHANTISWEIMTGISSRVPRVFT
jgi:alanine racemase